MYCSLPLQSNLQIAFWWNTCFPAGKNIFIVSNGILSSSYCIIIIVSWHALKTIHPKRDFSEQILWQKIEIYSWIEVHYNHIISFRIQGCFSANLQTLFSIVIYYDITNNIWGILTICSTQMVQGKIKISFFFVCYPYKVTIN
jgi:hypothetical protein